MTQILSGDTITPMISESSKGKAIVIGGGFGGLATAIRLQAAGHEVTLVEAREHLGGRAYQLKKDGFTFDMGPSLITAPHLLDDLWAAAGRSFKEDISLVPLSPFYRIYFHDGRYFDYWGTPTEDEAEIARFDPRDVEGYRAFLADTQAIYLRAFADLANQPFLTLSTFLGVAPELARVGAQRSVYSFVSRYFRNPQLRMVFSFHPLFIGGNPFRASAIYSIVPYLERLGGVLFAPGGMYTLVEAMERLLRSLGGEVRCGMPVEQIILTKPTRLAKAASASSASSYAQTSRKEKGCSTTGVRLEDGTILQADVVIANSDVASTFLNLLPASNHHMPVARRIKNYRYSMSCFMLYLGINRQYKHLRHHTIIMPDRYRKLIHDIFDGQGIPDDLALYLHVPTKTDPSMAPKGCESLYILAPVPNLAHGIDWVHEASAFRDKIIHFLEQEAGLEGLEASIVTEHTFTPLDFASELRSHLGAAFSIEPTLFQSAYFRPHNRSNDIEGLYFVGAGTHPGAGIPGVLLSANITSRLVIEDLARAQKLSNNGLR